MALDREGLKNAVTSAIDANGGEATIVQVAQYIWANHEADLRASGDLFFTWQYEMRWAAQKLRDESKLELSKRDGKKTWRKVGA
jgi:hypothetical protein